MRIALATCAALPDGWHDDRLLAGELRAAGADASFQVWDAGVDWRRFDLVVVRSTWDYTGRRRQFIDWSERVGDRLRNVPRLLRWNSDKRYLRDLLTAGIPVVETAFVDPGEPPPALEGEVVVKPAISAGARDTGRFSPAFHADAHRLLARLRSRGSTAIVQPYLSAVDAAGETAIVFLGGRESHVLRKRAVLSPDREAPLRDDDIGAAEVMFREDLVSAGDASGRQREVGEAVVSYLRDRFGTPLYARVDLVPDRDGRPVVLELEAVEPNLYMATAPASARRLAELILER